MSRFCRDVGVLGKVKNGSEMPSSAVFLVCFGAGIEQITFYTNLYTT
jgi:hypothetical protein